MKAILILALVPALSSCGCGKEQLEYTLGEISEALDEGRALRSAQAREVAEGWNPDSGCPSGEQWSAIYNVTPMPDTAYRLKKQKGDVCIYLVQTLCI